MSLQKAMSNIVYIKNNKDCATSAQWQIMVILISASHNFEPLTLPSPARGGEGKEGSIEDMPKIIFPIRSTLYSPFTYSYRYGLFTFHFSLK